MARGFGSTRGSGTTDKVVTTLTANSSTISMFIWSNRNGHGGGGRGYMVDSPNSAAAGRGLILFDNDPATAGTYSVVQSFGVGNSTTVHWTAPSANVWSAIGFSYDNGSGSNNPTVYQDGVKLTPGSGLTVDLNGTGTAEAPNGVSTIGNRNADNARNWDGDLAEFGCWNAILTDDEFFALCKGYSPLLIRPASLVEYVPMVRDNLSLKRAAPTITGTAVTNHPRIIYPRKSA